MSTTVPFVACYLPKLLARDEHHRPFYDRLPTSDSVPHRRGERQGGAAVGCHGAPPILRAHTHGPPCRIDHAAEGERPPWMRSRRMLEPKYRELEREEESWIPMLFLWLARSTQTHGR
ncbi:hypothetical protein PVAP13_4NG314001 [Panicum virgatum]|uniref:Uncharacterized protein n=1 Tax=Panicum virgatum TaxID=38727 RepID=A0A8T0T9B6_PANVG|nr:hypothetical protein PVAP13_4NG314001 [Panicum virgatum]